MNLRLYRRGDLKFWEQILKVYRNYIFWDSGVNNFISIMGEAANYKNQPSEFRSAYSQELQEFNPSDFQILSNSTIKTYFYLDFNSVEVKNE